MVKDINTIFSLVFESNRGNIYDTFGIFDTRDSFIPIFKRAYKVVKSRKEPVAIRNLWGDTFGVAYMEGQNIYLDWSGKVYRLM